MSEEPVERVLVGVNHGEDIWPTAKEAMDQIKKKPVMRAGYLEASRRIVELARRKPGSVVFIEHAPAGYHMLRLLTIKAEKEGLRVVPINKTWHARIDAHLIAGQLRHLAQFGNTREKIREKLIQDVAKKELPRLTLKLFDMPDHEVNRRKYTLVKSSNDIIIRQAARELPGLIIAGCDHVTDIAPVLERFGYANKTPSIVKSNWEYITQWENDDYYLIHNVEMRRAIDQQHDLHRERVLARIARR